MKELLTSLKSADLDALRERFVERQSGRMLAEEADLAEANETAQNIRAALQSVAGARDGRSLLTNSPDTPVPLGLVAIARAVLARRSRAHSIAARAASTGGALAREVGPYRLEVVEETDAIFILISVGDLPSPAQFQGLGPGGQFVELELPPPVAGTIQLGIASSDEVYDYLVAILTDPGSSIYFR